MAQRWLFEYRSASWVDDPAAWIDRVRPFVTEAMDERNEKLRDGGGADWSDFVSRRCTSTVVDIAALVPPESPGTVTAANVQVTGSVRTSCMAAPATSTEQASVTLVVVNTSRGWRVDQRLF